MPEKLTNIKIREISFVDKGASGDANNRAYVAFWKRKPEGNTKMDKELVKRLYAAIALQKAQMTEGAQALLETIKDKLSPEQWALVELMLANASELAPMPTQTPVESAADGVPDSEKPATDSREPDGIAKADDKDPAKDPAAAKKKPAKQVNPQDDPKTEGGGVESQVDKISKSNPEMAAILTSIEKRASAAEALVTDLSKRLEKSETTVASEIQKGRVASFTKVAETEMRYLQGTPAELAKQLCDLEDVLSKEEFAKHIKMLKSASKNLEKSGSFRPSGAPGAAGGSAYEEICKVAADLRKANNNLTEKQSIAKVMKSSEHRELVKRHREEH